MRDDHVALVTHDDLLPLDGVRVLRKIFVDRRDYGRSREIGRLVLKDDLRRHLRQDRERARRFAVRRLYGDTMLSGNELDRFVGSADQQPVDGDLGVFRRAASTQPSGPLSAGTLRSKTSDRPGRRPDDMMTGTCLDSTETTSALDISQAEQASQPFAEWKCPHGESALTVRNQSFSVRSYSLRCTTGRSSALIGSPGTLRGIDLRLADPTHRRLRCPGSKPGYHRFVKMSITLALQTGIKCPDMSKIRKF